MRMALCRVSCWFSFNVSLACVVFRALLKTPQSCAQSLGELCVFNCLRVLSCQSSREDNTELSSSTAAGVSRTSGNFHCANDETVGKIATLKVHCRNEWQNGDRCVQENGLGSLPQPLAALHSVHVGL